MEDSEPGSLSVARALGGRATRRHALGGIAGGGVAAALTAALPRTAAAQDAPATAGGAPHTLNYALGLSEPKTFAGGTLRAATNADIPVLSGLSLNLLDIESGGLRELHWHTNAAELNYVLEGTGTIAIYAPSGEMVTFPIRPGSITFIPLGYAHYIRNTGSETLRLLVAFSNENAGHLDMSQVFPWVPTDLLSQNLGVAPGTFPLLAPRGDLTIVTVDAETTPPPDDGTPYSVHVDDLDTATFAGGTVQPVRISTLPALAQMTLLKLDIDPRGLREAHWHTNASEFNYCASGTAQIGVVSPSGDAQMFVVEAGDVAYIPANWFHYIVSIDDEPLVILAFFDNVAPDRIDLSELTDRFPPEVLAASVGIDPAIFAGLPKRGDIVIAPPLKAPAATPMA